MTTDRLAEFLGNLLEEGRVSVADAQPPSVEAIKRARPVLQSYEAVYRREMPGRPPAFSVDAAAWAAVSFYRGCQFVVFRDVAEQEIHEELSRHYPGALPPDDRDPASHYSVDLVLRFLPDLARMAHAASVDDPLLKVFHQWARQWPLSSVGLTAVEDLSVGPIKADPVQAAPLLADASLSACYADRIIRHNDRQRLTDPQVRQAVRAALGMHQELAPVIAKALAEYDEGNLTGDAQTGPKF